MGVSSLLKMPLLVFHIFSFIFPGKNERGIAALPAVLMIGGIIMQLAIVGLLLAYLYSSSSYGNRLATEALNAARAGAQDAITRVIRDKTFSTTSYTLTTNGRDATVVVTRDSPTTGQDTITATVVALTHQKKIQAIIAVSTTTGQVEVLSFGEVSI